MNVLMLTNSILPYKNANSEIVYNIAEVLERIEDCDVVVLGIGPFAKQEVSDCSYLICQEALYKSSKFSNVFSASSKFEKIVQVLKAPSLWKECIQRFFRGYDGFIINRINEICKLYKIDIIIGFSNPTLIPKLLSSDLIDIPYISYKLDPWSTHYNLSNSSHERNLELLSDRKAKAIIATDLILKDYKNIGGIDYFDKIFALEFPNVINRIRVDISEQRRSDGKIRCVFAGALYHDIRNPKYTLDLFKKLEENNIILEIYGPLIGECFDTAELPNNIVYHGIIPSEDSLKEMNNADVLVNIGNTVLNQMPSKLLTYISFGLPILNIVKDEKCPTLKYTKKYPCSFDVIESAVIDDELVKSVKKFIMNNAGRRIAFNEIENVYNECTPQYVAGQLYEIINRICN